MHSPDLAFEPEHDHNHCIEQALKDAAQLCRQRQQRFTPIRELVLRLIWQSHKPLGAYELLPALAEAGFNSAPPTVYRALDFLQEQGLVHRIASLNAYIGCAHPDAKCHNRFLICTACHSAMELDFAPFTEAIAACAQTFGFEVQQDALEITGLCPACRRDAAHG